MIKNFILVATGGALGCVLRYIINTFFVKSQVSNFPWSTFISNVLGCFFIGLLSGLLLKNTPSEFIKLFLITGFCGGFTTFSAFSLENIQFLQNQQYLLAFLYTFSTFIITFLAVFLGIKIHSLCT